MIRKLNHKDPQQTQNIYQVFQDSYAIEAKILNAKNFPPLKRTKKQFVEANTCFFGYRINHILAAVIELDIKNQLIHIQSLVVDPQYFRQGIAVKLLDFVFGNFNKKLFTVETGVDNVPAVRLYKKFGFVKTKQYDTNHSIRKIRLEMHGKTLNS